MIPLDDEECREFSLWETPAEIHAFRAGWQVRRAHGPWPFVEAKALPWICDHGQNERVAFERGWLASNAVRNLLLDESTDAVVHFLKNNGPHNK